MVHCDLGGSRFVVSHLSRLWANVTLRVQRIRVTLHIFLWGSRSVLCHWSEKVWRVMWLAVLWWCKQGTDRPKAFILTNSLCPKDQKVVICKTGSCIYRHFPKILWQFFISVVQIGLWGIVTQPGGFILVLLCRAPGQTMIQGAKIHINTNLQGLCST